MKAILIFLPLIFLAVLTGCSDDPFVSDFYNAKTDGDSKYSNQQGIEKVIWRCSSFAIVAKGEHTVSDELIWLNGSKNLSNIRISFDGYTNADTSTYISQICISADQELVYFITGGYYINEHHEIFLNIIDHSQLRFYLSLWCDEINCTSAVLIIYNVKIFRL